MTSNVSFLARAAEARRDIPKVIRLLLAVSGTRAKDLGEALGVSEQSMSERLTGKTRISSEEIAACALFFDVDPGVFYRDPDGFRKQIMGSRTPAGEPTYR